MSFEVRVNNKNLLSFKSGSLTRSIDSNSGSWSVSSSYKDDFQIKAGDWVQILIDNDVKCTGYCDRIDFSEDASSHEINAYGRDSIQDVIDSSIPSEAKVTVESISLLGLVKKVVNSLTKNIFVRQSKGINIQDFSEKDFENAELGGNAMDFLTSFARLKQVYLVSDGRGGFGIWRPLLSKSNTPLINKKNNDSNNIISCTGNIDLSNRYNTYFCKSQDNVSSEEYDNNSNVEGVAYDKSIRDSRYLEFQLEQSSPFNSDCTNRAKEMANLRRARGTTYACIVQGFSQNDGNIWDIGQQVKLIDEIHNINGYMVIKQVTYSFSLDEGSTTALDLATIDAYQVIPEISKLSDTGIQRKSDISSNYSVNWSEQSRALKEAVKRRDFKEQERLIEEKKQLNYIDSWRPKTEEKKQDSFWDKIKGFF